MHTKPYIRMQGIIRMYVYWGAYMHENFQTFSRKTLFRKK